METWQKGATVVKKMSKSGQSTYFKKFPERQDWFQKNHPDMAHFDKSVKQASMTGTSSAVSAAREKASLKAYGATKGTKVGEIGGERAAADKDTTVPLSPEQHSKIQAAKRSAVKPAAASTDKPVDRLSLIKQLHKKSQSASGKMQRAAKHDVPTEDPDDASHDDLRDVHNSLHVRTGHYSESVELDESPAPVAPSPKRTTDIQVAIKAYKGSMTPVGSRLYGKVLGRLSKKYGWSEKELHDHIAHEATVKEGADRSEYDANKQLANTPKKAPKKTGGQDYFGDYAHKKADVKEEAAQLVELSRALLQRYAKAAKANVDDILSQKKYQNRRAPGTHIDKRSGYEQENFKSGQPITRKDLRKIDSREGGKWTAKQKLSRVSQQVKVKADNQPTLSAKRQASFKFEEVEQVTEGRPSQQHPLEGHPYHKKSNDELEYIAKDAHKAAEAMKSHNTTAENKYRDQASDSATVRNFRKKSGMPSWYKKKYSLGEEAINERLSKNNPPAEWIKDFVASDNPKFSGKSKKERITMALGAYYSQKRKG